ncbi:hypothetical protein NP493_1867g00003 [Ridgeia piscesae]|uniref:Uncharacterized protein n=1 Tax=Ridgeia piscesae TaxID=27915 RepID=A0AAD9N4X0_RIDPI|nr:hypothetical protein NP493_1867g00003 [Ridgeia piscesae]
MPYCTGCSAHKRPTKACMCAIITAWTVIALCSLVITSLLNLGPYIQEWRYRRTSCDVLSTFYTTQYVCTCGVHCQSTYPCFFVHVTFTDGRGVRASVGLYTDTTQQKSVIDVATEHQEMASQKQDEAAIDGRSCG